MGLGTPTPAVKHHGAVVKLSPRGCLQRDRRLRRGGGRTDAQLSMERGTPNGSWRGSAGGTPAFPTVLASFSHKDWALRPCPPTCST